MQGTVRADGSFMDVIVAWEGSSSHATIFRTSELRGLIHADPSLFSEGTWLLGDKGYC